MTETAVRAEHPLTALLLHYFHLVSMIVLIISGFYIHYPIIPGLMGLMRGFHMVGWVVLIVVGIWRVIWAFVGRSSGVLDEERQVADYKHFGYQRENRGTFWPTVSYYLFIRKNPPPIEKFNPLQKLTYLLWLLLIVLAAITGWALWGPTENLFQPLTLALGGLQYMRMYHYIIMWLFILTVALHVYLSALHVAQLRLMFAWRETTDDQGYVAP